MSLKVLPRAALARAISLALATSPLLVPQVAAAQNVDLGNLGDRGFRIDGIDANDSSGFSVSGAGDVNGDGLADLIVGAFNANGGGGESYVVFGKAGNTPVDLASLRSSGFRIHGRKEGIDQVGISVSGAGDVNGDGLADLIVGASGADDGVGEAYVVFGKPDNTPVDLAALGAGGFQIIGDLVSRRFGSSVSGAGDINGDGLADLIIGAPSTSLGQLFTGDSYVVFGKASNTPVDIGNLGEGGFRIVEFPLRLDQLGISVSGAGDVNGDGLADLIIGTAPLAFGFSPPAEKAYVVFGKTSSSPVNPTILGGGGFRIDGIDALDGLGRSVSGAGDVNGDGLADLIVSAPFADPIGDSAAGESYVVFGKASSAPVVLANLGSLGFRIDGIDVDDFSGRSVSGAGDVNGDGLADLIVGADGADPGGDSAAGESYVVYGKANSAVVDLANLGSGGFRIDGIDADDVSGSSVSGAGDVNGDGLADLIVGAPRADPGGDSNAGESYVVFGASVPPASATYGASSRNGNPPKLAVGISGDGSNDSTPDARFWIDFADGNGPTAAASTETVTLIRSAGGFVGATANVSWRLQTTRQNWTSAEVTVRYLDQELKVADETKLDLYFSASGGAPYTPLISAVNPLNNTISANITQAGFLYVGGTGADLIFSSGFEVSAR